MWRIVNPVTIECELHTCPAVQLTARKNCRGSIAEGASHRAHISQGNLYVNSLLEFCIVEKLIQSRYSDVGTI